MAMLCKPYSILYTVEMHYGTIITNMVRLFIQGKK